MEVRVKPGKYVVAVSGGVDSMALLDMLTQQPELSLVVAHFEHGIRTDSDEDRQLVELAAERYGLPFVFARGNLGAGVSETTARAVRYAFLQQTREVHNAVAIITAHHQDDVLETAFINLLRGTGSRGLASLQSTDVLVRPLLDVSKEQVLAYAKMHGLAWREDSTNADEQYLRNYLRRRIMPRMTAENREQLLQYVYAARHSEQTIGDILLPRLRGNEIDRQWFMRLPYAVSAAAMALWLRTHATRFDRRAIHRLVVFAKTAAPGTRADIDLAHYLYASKNHITLVSR
ncbi:MAG TPA: tRNA lysidine(34) synthetase TilS [Patescibacteria group bacterium]|nr:tRNA lysidine(34) synthetase TilS [Patescibacteria group bacterium]